MAGFNTFPSLYGADGQLSSGPAFPGTSGQSPFGSNAGSAFPSVGARSSPFQQMAGLGLGWQSPYSAMGQNSPYGHFSGMGGQMNPYSSPFGGAMGGYSSPFGGAMQYMNPPRMMAQSMGQYSGNGSLGGMFGGYGSPYRQQWNGAYQSPYRSPWY